MNINMNQIVNFALKWLGVGIALHFGLKLGALLDGAMPFI